MNRSYIFVAAAHTDFEMVRKGYLDSVRTSRETIKTANNFSLNFFIKRVKSRLSFYVETFFQYNAGMKKSL
jgi:hypothetical protein